MDCLKEELELYKNKYRECKDQLEHATVSLDKILLLLDFIDNNYNSPFDSLNIDNLNNYLRSNNNNNINERDLQNGKIGLSWVWEYRKIMTMLDIAYDYSSECKKEIEELIYK